MTVFTFICLTGSGATTVMDIQAMAATSCREHAQDLLRRHASAMVVEIWSDDVMVDRVER
ncbi:hypothetical protein [Caulobacter sp.]|uniref:hypothetical protein n=1 Tax=Caulobacter sp. TaxID=78 RepID=UPI0031DD4F62